MKAQSTGSVFLRRALQANAIFSALSGIALVGAADPLAKLFGLPMPVILRGLGVCLVGYAGMLFLNAVRDSINRIEAWIAVILDLAWVVGSGILIFVGLLSPAGNWAVAVVADIVLLFAVLQFLGIRRLWREGLTTPRSG